MNGLAENSDRGLHVIGIDLLRERPWARKPQEKPGQE